MSDSSQENELFASAWYLSGATASGKTAVALELAERLDAEILSMDSMAIYRGMDIGTAKPSVEQRQRLPHHLLDLLEPDQEFSVSEYRREAFKVLQEIRGRGKQTLFVGGTPLYLKALLRGVFEGPPADWDFRRQVEQEIERLGEAALHERLRQVDPLSAAKLHPHDHRRVIRALEVLHLTGQPISHWQTQFEEGAAAEQRRVFVLSWPRPLLHQRIEQRVESMFAAGLIQEAQALLNRFGELSRTAGQAVGYREAIAHLRDDAPFDEAIESVKARTRQFARRQETWFRSLSECRFVPLTEEQPAEQLAEEILEKERRSERETE